MNLLRNTFTLFCIAVTAFWSCQEQVALDTPNAEQSVTDATVASGQRNASSPYWTFYRGKDTDRIYYSVSLDEGNSWLGNEPTDDGIRSSNSPSAAVIDNRFVLVYNELDGSKLYHATSSNGIDWYRRGPLGNGAKIDGQPAMTKFKDKLYVFYKDKSSDDLYVSYSKNGKDWEGNERVKDLGKLRFNPMTVTYQNKIWVAYINDNNKVKLVYSSNGKDWYKGSSTGIESNHSVALAKRDGKVYMVYAEGDKLYLAKTNNMEDWEIKGKIDGATTDKSTSLASNGDNMILTFKGKDSDDVFRGIYNKGKWQKVGRAIGSTKSRPYVICE